MEKSKPKSLTRIPIQLYPEVKQEFDQLHETMGTVNTSETGTAPWNKFAMGVTENFDAGFSLSEEILTFNMYLTMGYGFSAKKSERLMPKYYNPEFNRKAAWKVDVQPQNREG